MSENSSSTVTINAPLADLAAILSNVAGYPEWLSSIKKAQVIDSDSSGRSTKALVSIDAGVMKDRVTLDYDYSQAPNVISFSLDEADLLTDMTGSYILKAVDSDTTEVTYQLGVALSMPVPAMMIRKVEKSTVDQALKELKDHAE